MKQIWDLGENSCELPVDDFWLLYEGWNMVELCSCWLVDLHGFWAQYAV